VIPVGNVLPIGVKKANDLKLISLEPAFPHSKLKPHSAPRNLLSLAFSFLNDRLKPQPKGVR
jgi:hypothetical protein